MWNHLDRRLSILPSWLHELLAFGIKEARACVFAGSFFLLLAVSRWLPLGGLARYDFLLIAALALQVLLVVFKVESWRDVRTLALFHALGFVLEVFKTHPAIGSWSYPEPGISKLFGVPLYAGFMYAAVASYMLRAWHLFDLRLERPPPMWLAVGLCALIYINFFSHHFIGDVRGWLALALVLACGRTWVRFQPARRRFRMPLLASFALIGFFVWIAENIATLFGAWVYPDQAAGWRPVSFGKVGSWTLLVVISFVIVAVRVGAISRSRPTRARHA